MMAGELVGAWLWPMSDAECMFVPLEARMIPVPTGGFAPLLERARHVFPIVMTLALFVLLVVALASTYLGHSRGPYDGCYGENGRAIACAVLEAVR